jgi:hypothetical protein
VSSCESFILRFATTEKEELMGKFAIALAAAGLMLASMALTADAQSIPAGAASFHGMAKNATPITQVACRGYGRFCPPGLHRVCGPARCWCAPC